MTDEELAEIERVWTAALPGPWHIADEGVVKANVPELERALAPLGVSADVVVAGRTIRHYDSTVAIAKAPEHIAALLAEVKRLREQVNDLE